MTDAVQYRYRALTSLVCSALLELASLKLVGLAVPISDSRHGLRRA